MSYQIVLPIFEIKPSRLSKVSLVLLYVGLIFLFSNRFFFEVEFLYFLAFGFILPAILIEISINKTKDAGLIYFDDFGIKINKSETISISEISDLKITIVGFEGKMTGFLKGMDSGNNNIIEFTHNNVKYNYRFFLSYQKMVMLDYISDKWKKEYPQLFRKEKSFFKDFILGKLGSKK
jgi:hypothetical protein